MKNIFKLISNENDAWIAKCIGEPNGNPVSARIMNNFIAPFHTHESSDEMFIVLSGILFIDVNNETVELNSGESYTVDA